LEADIGDTGDGIVDAIKENIDSLLQSCFRQPNSMQEAGAFRSPRKKQAQFLAAQIHVRKLSAGGASVKLPE
jgi:hypothetical protein